MIVFQIGRAREFFPNFRKVKQSNLKQLIYSIGKNKMNRDEINYILKITRKQKLDKDQTGFLQVFLFQRLRLPVTIFTTSVLKFYWRANMLSAELI